MSANKRCINYCSLFSVDFSYFSNIQSWSGRRIVSYPWNNRLRSSSAIFCSRLWSHALTNWDRQVVTFLRFRRNSTMKGEIFRERKTCSVIFKKTNRWLLESKSLVGQSGIVWSSWDNFYRQSWSIEVDKLIYVIFWEFLKGEVKWRIIDLYHFCENRIFDFFLLKMIIYLPWTIFIYHNWWMYEQIKSSMNLFHFLRIF